MTENKEDNTTTETKSLERKITADPKNALLLVCGIAVTVFFIYFVATNSDRRERQANEDIAKITALTAALTADFPKGLTAYKSGDYATALREWTPLAKQGNVSAQFNLGLMYETGQGVPKDYKTAVKWYRLAAEQGHPKSQYNLGVMYDNGQGVLQDYVRAHMWYNIAAISGKSKNASKNRDLLAKQMNSNQIETAQKLARECVRKNYKGC